jgi:oligo-1,6-glucosidase
MLLPTKQMQAQVENHADKIEADKKMVERSCHLSNLSTKFKDSNGDGVGDLKIISKLDYIKSLGIEAIWLNQFMSL